MDAMNRTRRFRSIWISDVHLGTPGCKANRLLEFLKQTESENLFLVGDIIDGWRLKRSWYWPQEHNDVVQKILRKARKGTNVVFIPGNHDEFARGYCGLEFGKVKIRRQAVHTTATGKRLLILHGDEFDVVVRYAKWLAFLGDWAYNVLMRINHLFNWFREQMGRPYWSLSAYLKHKVKTPSSSLPSSKMRWRMSPWSVRWTVSYADIFTILKFGPSRMFCIATAGTG